MQKNFKCCQCGHRFIDEDDIMTKCPECGSDLLQPISPHKVHPWMYALAFIAFLAIGFGVSELIQPKSKFFAMTENDVAVDQELARYEEENVREGPHITLKDSSTDEPVMEDSVVPSPVTDNPVAAPSKTSHPTVQPTPQPTVTPLALPTTPLEPRPVTVTPSTPVAQPAPATTVVPEPKPVTTTTATLAAEPATTTTTPEPKPTTMTATVASQTPIPTQPVIPTPSVATTKTGLTAAEAQGIVATGKASSKIPDNTTITVNGQKMDYQAFRTGVNQKAYSNIKVTGVNPDGSIVVKATSHYED